MSDSLKISAEVKIRPEVIEQLKNVRAEMIQRFNDHTTGKNTLPAELSLALRSHISNLTKIIEPGVKEMWSDYSSAEKEYLEELAINNQRNANNIGVAALGPLALPAVVANGWGAPPETVSDFLALGFNMTAVKGLSKVGLQPMRNGVVEPITVSAGKAKPEFEFLERAPTKVSATNNAFFNGRPITNIKDYISPRVSALKVARSAMNLSMEAEPILTWLENPKIEKLGLFLAEYSGGRGQLLADLREEGQTGKTIKTILDEYRNSPEGRSDAYKQAYAFEKRFVRDMLDINGELDPTKLQLMIARLQAGQYLTAREYAALEQVRHLAHTNFIDGKVNDYVDMAKLVQTDGKVLQQGINEARQQAETLSPYRLAPDAVQNSSAPDLGHEP